MPFFITEQKGDVVVGDHEIAGVRAGATLSSVREQVGHDRGDGGALEGYSMSDWLWMELRRCSARSTMAQATGAASGNRFGRGVVSFWVFPRPLRAPETSGPSATGGRACSCTYMFIADK